MTFVVCCRFQRVLVKFGCIIIVVVVFCVACFLGTPFLRVTLLGSTEVGRVRQWMSVVRGVFETSSFLFSILGVFGKS